MATPWLHFGVSAVHAYSTEGRWPAPDKQRFRLRRTDLHVHDRILDQTGRSSGRSAPRPTGSRSPSGDSPACEVACELSGIRFDRAGADRVVEASLLLWGLPREGYKSYPGAREELLAALEPLAPLSPALTEFALALTWGVAGA
jgi:hypothetical protein